MMTRLDTRPVEQSTGTPPPGIVHLFCKLCEDAQPTGSKVFSFCGTRTVTVGELTEGRNRPTRHQCCAVCWDLLGVPCPKCGARHGR